MRNLKAWSSVSIRSMEKQGDKKFTWVINNYFSKQSEACQSDEFEIGGVTWRIGAAPINPETLSLYLELDYGPSSPTVWRRYVKYRLTIVNQLSEELSLMEEGLHWFDSRACDWFFISSFPLPILHDRDGGFLVNGELKIVAEVDFIEVIGKLDESQEAIKSLRKFEGDDGAESSDFLEETSSVKKSMDVNGFQVLPSQVKAVRRIFERHPDIAVEFRAKNQLMRTTCINFLLSLIETLCQSLEELSSKDLLEADVALTYVKDAGFMVDWLEKKLDQVKVNKEKEQFGLAQLQETEGNLLKLKQKCAELDALAEEQKRELSATRTRLSFDDLV